ncbi:unnamed protein product [Lactuca saligna]|uniref:Uncharacterized protein n=1 Tax=Lactuca saligna TaxID=75948 RepID=A0AA35Y697_LACSI|nr:unnamed protein product [Lactuca saligna]
MFPEVPGSTEADKPKKGGQKGVKKGEKRTTDKEGPSAAAKPPTKKKAKVAPSTAAPKRRKQLAHKPSGEPAVSVNASDVGAKTSGFQLSHVSPPVSPIHQDDPNMIYGHDEDELAGFTYTPFTVRNESDDEAPVTKGQLKAINETLDTQLQVSKPSSS